MTTASDRIKALQREFNAPGATMSVDTYKARLEALHVEKYAEQNAEPSQPPPEPARPGAPVVAGGITRPLLESLMAGIGSFMREQLDERDAEIAKLEARLATLETRPTLRYMGVWAQGISYRAGDFVTDHGSMFHCNETGTKSRPGDGAGWQLAVKRGMDGRGAK